MVTVLHPYLPKHAKPISEGALLGKDGWSAPYF
jgi:hypothetical protein